jgi:hypothetical protein
MSARRKSAKDNDDHVATPWSWRKAKGAGERGDGITLLRR